MRQDINVVIVEDDPFARNWMVLIAVRDWRTRVVGEADTPGKLIGYLEDPNKTVDFVLLDTDIPGGEDWLPRIHEILKRQNKPPKVLCTGIRASSRVLHQLDLPAFTGYILKDEIAYSLAWAISLAIDGNWVITDSIQALAAQEGFALPSPCMVLNGRGRISHLSQRQADVARLAFLFSIERRELADELGVGEDWGYQLVSAIYDNLGLPDFINDEEAVQDYFKNSALILSYIDHIKKDSKAGKKSKDMETLAFHMLTMPEVKELK